MPKIEYCFAVCAALFTPVIPASGISPAGSGGSAAVYRDGYGVPHIFAGTNRELFYGFGFVCAQDRLFQADVYRRAAQGRLSEIFGRGEDGGILASDKLARMAYPGRENYLSQYEALSPEYKADLSG